MVTRRDHTFDRLANHRVVAVGIGNPAAAKALFTFQYPGATGTSTGGAGSMSGTPRSRI